MFLAASAKSMAENCRWSCKRGLARTRKFTTAVGFQRKMLQEGPADGFDGQIVCGSQDYDAAALFFVEANKRVVTAGAAGVSQEFGSRWLIRVAIDPIHGSAAERAET